MAFFNKKKTDPQAQRTDKYGSPLLLSEPPTDGDGYVSETIEKNAAGDVVRLTKTLNFNDGQGNQTFEKIITPQSTDINVVDIQTFGPWQAV